MHLSPKCDVWSIGAILYLMVTGGTTDKKHEEMWDFSESAWHDVCEELKEFMMLTLAETPRERASVDALIATDFITMSRGHRL